MEISEDTPNDQIMIENYTELLKEKLSIFTKKQEMEKITDENSFRAEMNSYQNLSENFIKEYSTKTDYIQYARTYFSRLVEIKQDLLKQAAVKWRNLKLCENILDMKGKEVQIIAGVIYKEMPLKPSILKGMESILGSKKVESFVNNSEDFLIIEDDSGRVRIANTSPMKAFSPGDFISGLVAAVKGSLDERGVFNMEDVLYYKVNNYSIPMRIRNSFATDNSGNSGVYNILSSNNKLLCFISGLQVGKTDHTGKLALARNLLIDLIQGRFTTEGNINRLVKRISRIIVAGNSIFAPEETESVEKGSYLKQDLNALVYRTLLQNYEELDNYYYILSQTVAVDVMPGTEDNSSSMFPQLPINNILLPTSSTNSSVNLVPNPYKLELDDLLILGTSGQNVDNIRKYTSISKDPCDILEKTLEWSHMSPCAPDTLSTYPIVEQDPLLLKEIPNVYFVGNQKKFASKVCYYSGLPLRLIAVPDFSSTFSFVLMDMNTLETCEYALDLINE